MIPWRYGFWFLSLFTLLIHLGKLVKALVISSNVNFLLSLLLPLASTPLINYFGVVKVYICVKIEDFEMDLDMDMHHHKISFEPSKILS